jgi:tetratricopeptide (TPR) repeat protein
MKQRQQQSATATITSGMGAFARQCLADFNKCIQLDGRDPQAYFYRGSVRLALALDQDQKPAALSTNGTASTDAKPVKSPNAVTRELSDSGEPTANVVASPASIVSYMSAAEQLEAAFADIEMACTLCPTGTPYQIGMAMIMQLKQRHSDARSMFEAVASSSPDNRQSVLVQFHTALCCHALGDYERALELLTDALDVLPDEPLFLEARGLMLQEMRVHPLALGDFSHALELLEGYEDRHANQLQILGLRYLRAESALRLGRYQDAVDDSSAAIAGGPSADMAAFNARGMALRGLGDYDRALSDLNVRFPCTPGSNLPTKQFLMQACVTQAPKNDVFRFHRALCLMECARYSEALPDLHETATHNTRDTKYVWVLLALILSSLSSPICWNCRLLYYMGLCYYHERQPSECVVFMKRALECQPTQELLPDLYVHIRTSVVPSFYLTSLA